MYKLNKSSPHIAILGELSKNSYSKHGGTGQGLIRLSNAIYLENVRVDVITSQAKMLMDYNDRLSSSINLIEIGKNTKKIQFVKLFYYIIKNKPNVLIARNTRSIQLGIWIKRIFNGRINLICSIHHESVVRHETKKRLERSKKRFFKNIYRLSEGVVAVSPGIMEAIGTRISLNNKKTKIIPDPAYLDRNIINAYENVIPRPNKKVPHLISVGRLSDEKRHDLIIQSLYEIIYKKKINVNLSIIGDGANLSKLKSQCKHLGVQEYVYFKGYVRNPLCYMADADIFVLSSSTEAFGNVLVEALALGLTIVSTDCPYGPKYVLENGRYGILVENNSSEALTNGIVRAFRVKIDKNHLKERARQFNTKSIAYEYIKMIHYL